MILNRFALRIGWGIALFAVFCFAGLAQDEIVAPGEEVVYKGIDVWHTPADGMTMSNFKYRPIPADFFCPGSKPFTGIIAFKGRAVRTFPEGVLGEADTVIERLDDAVFDEKGVAYTRIRFAALHLEGIEPLETECGFFNVTVTLNGEQPVTSMRLTREGLNGGRMESTLSGDVKLTFTPLRVAKGSSAPLELTQSFRFAPNSQGVWAFRANRHASVVSLDTDQDGIIDSKLPGPSNFAAGMTREAMLRASGSGSEGDPDRIDNSGPYNRDYPNCHCDPTQGFPNGGFLCQPHDPSIFPGCLHLHCPFPNY